MKWIVAIDALGTSGGAIAFADVLARAGEEVVPVHVVEFEERFLPERVAESFRDWSREAAEQALAEHGPHLGSLHVLEATPPEAGIEHAAKELGADRIVIGRRAPVEGGALVRLGPVARRLARNLVRPVCVVPRDYTFRAEQDDPVVLATDASETAAGAAAEAKRLAAALARPLVVVLSVEEPRTLGGYLSGGAWDEVREAMHDAARQRLDAWCEAHGLAGAARRVRFGTPWGGVLGEVEAEGGTLIVCGSRRLGAVDRIFLSSTASELASAATVPVLIVPPDAAERGVDTSA